MKHKDLTVYGIVDLGSWNTTVVLPLEQASILAGLITEGQVFREYATGEGEAYHDHSDDGRAPRPPQIEVITAFERALRYERGKVAREKRKAEAEATNVVHLAKE